MFGFRQKLLPAVARSYDLFRLSRTLKRRLSLDQLRQMGLSRNEQYLFCLYCFDRVLPQALRAHRYYYRQNGRGFGEDAFHAMWFLLFEKLRPRSALEIGVYRGQTITLWKLLSRHFASECQVGCVSPFTPAGDSVSCYEQKVNYYEDVLLNHRHFDLPPPEFCREFSTSPQARDFISQRKWDVIYIDGNHDYEIAKQDWAICSQTVTPGGVIVLDDSALETDYDPPSYATAGHPGPSRVAREIDPLHFREILGVGHNRVFQRVVS